MSYAPHEVMVYPPLVGRITLRHRTKGIIGYFPLDWWPSAVIGSTWRDWIVVKVEQPARERLRRFVNER